MTYTVILRDEHGNERIAAEVMASEITQSTVLLCPVSGRLTSIGAEILKSEFERRGVYAIVCTEPIQVYQVVSRLD